jgi:hypothetical protein
LPATAVFLFVTQSHLFIDTKKNMESAGVFSPPSCHFQEIREEKLKAEIGKAERGVSASELGKYRRSPNWHSRRQMKKAIRLRRRGFRLPLISTFRLFSPASEPLDSRIHYEQWYQS